MCSSDLVNTTTQVGGSLGTALLSTLAATAASSFIAGNQPTPALAAHAAVHGYTTAFWWAAGIFAVGALLTFLLLRGNARPLQVSVEPEVQPAGAS